MAKEKDIIKFHDFSGKFLDSDWFSRSELDGNVEISKERIGQLFFNRIDSNIKESEMKRYMNSDESFTLLLWLDMSMFDLAVMAIPERMKIVVDDKSRVKYVLDEILLKIEVVVYILEKFTETDDSVREFMMRYIDYLNSEFKWLNANVDELFTDYGFNEYEYTDIDEKLTHYKECIEAVKIYANHWNMNRSFRGEFKKIEVDYRDLQVVDGEVIFD